MYNKKAAIGATMTWIVATIIILFVIIIFVYGSGVLKKNSSIGKGVASSRLTDSTKEQMLLALLETEIEGRKVKDQIESDQVDYKKLKKEIELIISKLPERGDGLYLLIFEDNDKKLEAGKFDELGKDVNPAIVYILNKKIEFGIYNFISPV